MKKVIFLLCFIVFVITLRESYNLGIYVDAFNTSPDVVLGSDFWLNMSWLKLMLLSIMTLLSFVHCFKGEKYEH